MTKAEYFWLAALYLCYVQAEEEYEQFKHEMFRLTGDAVMRMFELTERRSAIYDFIVRGEKNF